MRRTSSGMFTSPVRNLMGAIMPVTGRPAVVDPGGADAGGPGGGGGVVPGCEHAAAPAGGRGAGDGRRRRSPLAREPGEGAAACSDQEQVSR